MSSLPESNQLNSVKEGDIFQLGNHVLSCAKAEDKDMLKKTLQEKKIHLILTDPPYSCNYVEGKHSFSKLLHEVPIENDHLQSEETYKLFTRTWLAAVKLHLSTPNCIYIFNSDKMAFAVKQAIEDEGGRFSQLLIWVKNHSVIGRLDYNPQHELILYGWFGKHTFYKSKDKSVLCYLKPNKSRLHPTMKPIPLLRHLILNSSQIGNVVWDGFGGSGSTLIACQQTKRLCIMTEISPVYCQTIIERFKKIFPSLPVKKLTK